MSSAHKLPVAYEEAEPNPRDPVITLIGSDIPPAYLDDAEPSPLMESASRLWGRVVKTAKLSIVALLVGGYPAAIVWSHDIQDKPIALPNLAPWASPEAGTALTMIGRELTGPGWADDRPVWHPQSRLTALPAWQEGVISALSDYTLLSGQLATDADGNVDPDLTAAGRLLVPNSESEAVPRLNAAAEALQRYDGRLLRGLATAPMGQDSLQARLSLFADWGRDAQQRLQISANSAEAWPASGSDIEAIYQARAYAHVAGQLLSATLALEADLVSSSDAAEARDKAQAAWSRAARFNPIFISSQAGTGRFLSDHPATMAFYMNEAEAATRNFQAKLITQNQAPIAVAEAGDAAP